MKHIPFNINKSPSKKRKNRTKSREWRHKGGKTATDGSSASREMAGKTYSLIWRRIRELGDDPYTTHPLSFEEFDNIPDVANLKKEKE